MTTYITLLRGINVGGQKKILMKDLMTLYESMDFKNVKTYVQSGNVVFESHLEDQNDLAGIIEKKILETFGFPVSIIIRTADELKQIILNNPFIKKKGFDESKLYATFFSDIPSDKLLNEALKIKDEKDRFFISGREAYLFCPGGYGKTKFSNNFFEKKLDITATTRNWNTVRTLMEMVEG